VNPHSVREWKTLSEPVLLANIDFKRWRCRRLINTVPVTASESGRLNGLIVYFELKAGANTFFTTQPSSVDQSNHWCSPVYSFFRPIDLKPGSQFDLTYWFRFEDGTSGCAVRPRS